MSKVERLELAPGFKQVDSLEVSHRIAYTAMLKVFYRGLNQDEPRVLFEDSQFQSNCPLAWSSDGRTLFHGYDEIYAIDLSSGNARAITNVDGKFSINFHLYCLPGNDTLLTHASSKTLFDPASKQPRWNPDGIESFFLLKADGSELHRCTTNLLRWWHANPSAPQRILFQEFGKKHELWAMGPAEDNRSYIGTVSGRAGQEHWEVSATGKHIAYCYDGFPKYEGLFVGDVNGQRETLVSDMGSCCAWSTANNILAYKDRCALWTFDLQRDERQRIATIPGLWIPENQSPGFDSRSVPVWSPDGRLISFSLQGLTRPPKSNDPMAFDHDNYVSCHGVVDLLEKKVWLLPYAYWDHLAWQPR